MCVLCKFFAHGACLKGENCEFSHDWSQPSNNVCTFYQRGACSYGSKCRYDHVKPLRRASVPTPQTPSPSSSRPLPSSSYPAWTQPHAFQSYDEDEPETLQRTLSLDPAERPICSFLAVGFCHRGDRCPHVHGDLCTICGKHCLHPHRPEEREEHKRTCMKNKKQLEALVRSQEIECSVCLERVLSKPVPSERKFGLLSECDHPFCVSCIRNWRGSSPASGMDVNSALRACPICRKLSYFVIPSIIWYFSKDEKQAIVDGYMDRLRKIDCKHFDFGNGTCPFGTSCFYKHAYRDGTLEKVVLRHLDADDGSTVIAKDIRLSEFFSGLRL
ncbi:zinc finger (CCCH-type/C3HC4-type RING finger) family protein isoform X2 [Wolffia australiana]